LRTPRSMPIWLGLRAFCLNSSSIVC